MRNWRDFVTGLNFVNRIIVRRQPLNLGDESGKPLDGANKYTLHFEKGEMPPVPCHSREESAMQVQDDPVFRWSHQFSPKATRPKAHTRK